MDALRDMHLPPGFGFHPSDAELVSHYLKRKIHGQRIEYDLIPEVDIYKHEPWDLPTKCNLPIEDNKWHFFASRDRKYPTGSRSNRATRAGYWKSTGKDRAIKQNKRTLGTKKTLVFHEGRPPYGKRTEWIMHEYYINENECQASPDMKDAFVLCRVTKRDDWALENDNDVGNRNPHPQQLNGTATSAVIAEKQDDDAASGICAGELNHVATPTGTELSNDVATSAFIPHSPNTESELQAWLEELLDPSFNPVVDTGSDAPSLIEQHAESSNLQNTGSMAPKVEPDHASPMQNGTDDRDYLFLGDIDNILYDGTDDFNNAFDTNQAYSMVGIDHLTPNNFGDETWKQEPLLQQENYNANFSNENADDVFIVRRRTATASAANISSSVPRLRMQVRVNRMVTSNSETINQIFKIADNKGRMRSFKQSEAANSSEDHSKRGCIRGIKDAFKCSSARFKVLIAGVCMIGVAVAVLHGHYRSGISL